MRGTQVGMRTVLLLLAEMWSGRAWGCKHASGSAKQQKSAELQSGSASPTQKPFLTPPSCTAAALPAAAVVALLRRCEALFMCYNPRQHALLFQVGMVNSCNASRSRYDMQQRRARLPLKHLAHNQQHIVMCSTAASWYWCCFIQVCQQQRVHCVSFHGLCSDTSLVLHCPCFNLSQVEHQPHGQPQHVYIRLCSPSTNVHPSTYSFCYIWFTCTQKGGLLTCVYPS
jgi:hypothetical protein